MVPYKELIENIQRNYGQELHKLADDTNDTTKVRIISIP